MTKLDLFTHIRHNIGRAMEKIITYLKQLELSEIEAKLYIALLKSGATSVKELAEQIDVKRTTAYFYIDQLIEKNLIIRIVKGAKKQVAVVDPEESLKQLMKQKVEAAQQTKEQFNSMIKSIASLSIQKEQTQDAEIKYYKGKQGIKTIYKEALESDEIRSYVHIEEVLKIFPENAELFNNAFKKHPEIKMYEICENSPKAQKQLNNSHKNHFYKILPKDMKITAQDILIYENKIAIIHLTNTPSGIVLYNNDIYTNFKLLFDFLWKILS